MDEEEIDNWYEEEKEKILQKYLTGLEEKSKRDAAEKKFDEDMGALQEKYRQKFESFEKKEKPREKNKQIEAVKGKISSFLKEIKETYK